MFAKHILFWCTNFIFQHLLAVVTYQMRLPFNMFLLNMATNILLFLPTKSYLHKAGHFNEVFQ